MSAPKFRLVQGRGIGERSGATSTPQPPPSIQSQQHEISNVPSPLAQQLRAPPASATPPPLQAGARTVQTPLQRVLYQPPQQQHRMSPQPIVQRLTLQQHLNLQKTAQQSNTATKPFDTRSASQLNDVEKCVRLLNRLGRTEAVQDIIRYLLHDQITATEFAKRLKETLNSQAQPQLIPFLERIVPDVREAVIAERVTFEFPLDLPTSPVPVIPAGQPMPVLQPMVAQQQPQQPPQSELQQALQTPQQQLPPPQQGSALLARLNTQPRAIPSPRPALMMPSTSEQSFQQQPQQFTDEPMRVQQPQQQPQHQHHVQQQPTQVHSQPQQVPQQQALQEVSVMQFTESKQFFVDPNYVIGRFQAILNPQALEENVVSRISDAVEYQLRDLITQVAFVAQHRTEALKDDENYIVIDDPKAQIKIMEDVDRQEAELRDSREKDILIRQSKAKNSSKETVERVKELQRADEEARRNRDADLAANAALSGSRPTKKWDNVKTNTGPKRPKIIRVNARDLHTVVSTDERFARSKLRDINYRVTVLAQDP